MFFFGDPADTAQIYWDKARGLRGPSMVNIHWEDMTSKQLKIAIVYARMAHRMAEQDSQPPEVMSILLEIYDELFEAMCAASEDFVTAVAENRHNFVGGYDRENIEKYKSIAGLSES